MLFFASSAIARAHKAVYLTTALSYSDAAQGRMRQAAVVLGILKVGRWFPWVIIGSKTQVVVKAIRFYELAGIHLPVGIPDSLEFAKRLRKFRAEHFGQEFGASLPVAVLAGQGAAVADNEVGSFFHEFPEACNSLLGLQVEVGTIVDASVSEVTIEGAAIAETGHQPLKVAQVAAKLF